MELREYLAIRRAYNMVRQELPAGRRLTFAELAILCRMDVAQRPMNTSEIAEYQGALRPTMTHRTKHLGELGFMHRAKGSEDRRNVVCEITEEGVAYLDEMMTSISGVLRSGPFLSRTSTQRLRRYVDAMGALSCMSGDLVLLGILQAEDARCTVSELVAALGLLQPTVSMSVSALVQEGLAFRDAQPGRTSRSTGVSLTDEGARRAEEMRAAIEALVVRRKS